MNQSFAVQLSELILLIIIFLAIVIIFMASIYDWRIVTKRRYFSAIITRLRKPRQPHVTVLIYAQGNNATIEACLDSVFRSRYSSYDVVVTDNQSRDGIWQIMRAYRSRHPKPNLHFYSKRKSSNRLVALQQGYRKSKKGDIVFTISASSIITPALIKQVVARFVADSKLDCLRLNEAFDSPQDLNSLTARFVNLSRHVYEKFTSLLHVGFIDVGRLGVVYRRSAFSKAMVGVKVNYRYAADLAISNPDPSVGFLSALQQAPSGWRSDKYRQKHDFRWLIHSSLGNFGKILMIISPLLITYFLYVAATLQSSAPLMISWAVVTLWFLLSIWSDETLKMKNKFGLIFCLPVIYFFVYVYLVVFGISQIAYLCVKAIKVWIRAGLDLIVLAERLAW